MELISLLFLLLIKSNSIANAKNSDKDNEFMVDKIAKYVPNNIMQDGIFFLDNLFESLGSSSTDLECKYTCPNRSS